MALATQLRALVDVYIRRSLRGYMVHTSTVATLTPDPGLLPRPEDAGETILIDTTVLGDIQPAGGVALPAVVRLRVDVG
jgi:hypothetical protein